MHKLKTLFAAACAFVACSAFADLVARWDFNNYDSSNPTSAGVLQATVGSDAIAAYGSGSSTARTDGTIGTMSVVNTGLEAGNYALAIPAGQHLRLPIPESVRGKSWTIRLRFYSPAASSGRWRCFFNEQTNTSDGRLFIDWKYNAIGGGWWADLFGSYGTGVTSDKWHTLVATASSAETEVVLDGTTRAISGTRDLVNSLNAEYLLLSADNDGEDNLLYFDYVEIYNHFDYGSAEERMLNEVSPSVTGEWTFPAANSYAAKVGADLVPYTRTGSADFSAGTDGVLSGDGRLFAGRNNGLKCYHGLPANADWTLAMDVRIPDNANKTKEWHSIFKSTRNGDALVFLRYAGGTTWGVAVTGNGTHYPTGGITPGTWARVVITYVNDGDTSIYYNGERVYTYNGYRNAYKAEEGGYFMLLADDDGEDWDTDISYAVIHDRALSEKEVATIHSHPGAQDANGKVIVTEAPAGLWSGANLTPLVGGTLADGEEGSKVWTRTSAPASATYVVDLTLAATQTAGGGLIANKKGVVSGIYGTTAGLNGRLSTTTVPAIYTDGRQDSTWGHWTLQALDRTSAHRVAVSYLKDGRVRYYVDGKVWSQRWPNNVNSNILPTDVMTFFKGLGATVTRLAAYDTALLPDEISALGVVGSEPTGAKPVATLTYTKPGVLPAQIEEATFDVSVTSANGESVGVVVDFGDGASTPGMTYKASGHTWTFAHAYAAPGTYTVSACPIAQGGVLGDPVTVQVTVVTAQRPAKDVLKTWPWQQNVYTNRFTIMCEAKEVVPNFELQWGEGYKNCTTMEYVKGNGNTYIYKARVEVANQVGSEIPYRLGIFGLPLTYESEEENTEGVVHLWSNDATASFSCSIWGDNQEGAKARDWDSDNYAYIRAMFRHMLDRKVDFGLSTGDMSSSGNYASQIVPGILVGTDGEFGRMKPYYVAWGNHDTSYPVNKPYFETPSIDEPGYLDSAKGNSYLYRNNVLFVLIDNQLMTAAETRTWLANLLATDRAKNAKFRIVLQHYPIFGECWGSIYGGLLETMVAGGVDIVFSGHMHGYERIEKGGIIQITNGGAGYLDHVESIVNNYGACTKVGAHVDVPYLWRRQASATVTDVLGLASPVRMGCIMSYGELSVVGDTLTYKAHGFNADGSYIGVFDSKTIVAKGSVGGNGEGNVSTYCADPSAFSEFTKKPVDNAAWKTYKDAIGESFDYPMGQGASPVVNVSKTEIARFCTWLNGANGANASYRLPTFDELMTAFGSETARTVAEWSSSVDPNSTWCRIAGTPSIAVEGTWAKGGFIATADCHADYLGFRLATGAAPIEPVDPMAAPLEALAQIADPAFAYQWEDGELVDISELFSGDVKTEQTFTVPVIFSGAGEVSVANGFGLTFAGGFAAPNAKVFRSNGAGALAFCGAVTGGVSEDRRGFQIVSGGTLSVENVTYRGRGLTFASADQTLTVTGVNDFSGVEMVAEGGDNIVVNFVAGAEGAVLALDAFHDVSASRVEFGAGLTVTLRRQMKIAGSYDICVNGTLETERIEVGGNVDPWYMGAGTIKTGSFGAYENSYQRLAISNIVLTSGRPFVSNRAKSRSYYFIGGASVRLTSLYDWTINSVDNLGIPFAFLTDTTREAHPKLILDGPGNVALTINSADLAAFPLEKAGTGTLRLGMKWKSDLTVTGGEMYVKNYPAAGTVESIAPGAWRIDETLALTAGEELVGPVCPGGTIALTVAAALTEGKIVFLRSSTLKSTDVTVTTDLPSGSRGVVEWTSDGTLQVVQYPEGVTHTAEWTGLGDGTSVSDPNNWSVRALGADTPTPGMVPTATTLVNLSGTIPFATPPAAALMLIDKNVTLGVAEADWSSAKLSISRGASLDLHGGRLTLGVNTTGYGIITDSTTDAENPGVLTFNVSDAADVCESSLILTGNLRLVKTGAGRYVAMGTEQTYTGGTLVFEGSLWTGPSVTAATYRPFGSSGTTITVDAGAVFDTRYWIGSSVYTIVLNGGQLDISCTGGETFWLGNLRQTADSTLVMPNVNWNHDIATVSGSTWDLGDCELLLNMLGNDPDLWIVNGIIIRNGTIRATGGGYFQQNGYNGADNFVYIAENDHLRVGAASSSIYGFVQARETYSSIKSDVRLSVYGFYRPCGTVGVDVTMKNGSVLDLSTVSAPWSPQFTNGSTCLFDNDATITVKLGKTYKKEKQIVSWTSNPNATFVLDATEAKQYRLVRDATGLTVVPKSSFVLTIY